MPQQTGDTSSFNSALWSAFISFLYSQGKIDVPSDFRTRIGAIRYLKDSDFTGVINTTLDYSVNSASQADYSIECVDDTLKALLNEWLRYINLEVKGIPTGVGELAREYYKERWLESSLIFLRLGKWRKITINGTAIEVPTVIWLINSASLYIDRKKDNYSLGTDRYFLDQAMEQELPQKNRKGENIEEIVIQRPYDRWTTQYATPYLIRKGIYRNFKALEMLQEKTEEVITKFLPYLFSVTKGTERMYIDGKEEYSDEDLQKMSDGLKDKLETYKRQKGKTPINVTPFDTKYEHIMPDLKKVLTEDLFNQGYRAILAGLGFIDVIQGITSTRKEAVLNPAPFVEETNDGVEGFKSLLMEIIHIIVQRNKIEHKKLFNREKQLYIASTPLKLNTQQILSELRLGYVYGVNSIKSYQLALGLNPDIEREQAMAEFENGDRSLYYPHIIQNLEQQSSPEEEIVPVKAPKTQKPPVSNKQIEKDIEKNGNPKLQYKMKSSEEQQTVEAGLPETIEDAPYKSLEVLPAPVQKLSKHLQQTWLDVFNKTYKGKDTEKKAFRVAWSVINKMRGKV